MEEDEERPYCMTCGYDITPDNDGIQINAGLATECFLCDDCHDMEFGHNINGDLLYFHSIKKQNRIQNEIQASDQERVYNIDGVQNRDCT